VEDKNWVDATARLRGRLSPVGCVGAKRKSARRSQEFVERLSCRCGTFEWKKMCA